MEDYNSNGPSPVKEPENKRTAAESEITFKIKRKYLRALGVALLMALAYSMGAFSATMKIYRRQRVSLFNSKTPSIQFEIPSIQLPEAKPYINGRYGNFDERILEDLEQRVREKTERYMPRRGR